MLKRSAFLAYLLALLLASLWALRTVIYTPLPSESAPVRFYSNQTHDNLSRLYRKALTQAKHSIDLSIYALTDPRLIDLVEKRAKAGVHITLHYDPKATTLPPSLRDKCTLSPHQGRALMHRKLLVIDHSLTLLGSANLTPTSLQMHDNLVAAIYNPPFATSTLKASRSTLNLPMQTGQLWLLPESNPVALKALLTHIQGAKKRIRLALFTLTHPDLVAALIDAHKRGVDVACILDHYTAEGASKQAQEALLAGGISVSYSRGSQLLHHKWVQIDGETLFFGSANWTRAAFSSNSEDLMILSPLTRDQRKFMHKLWKTLRSDSKQP